MKKILIISLSLLLVSFSFAGTGVIGEMFENNEGILSLDGSKVSGGSITEDKLSDDIKEKINDINSMNINISSFSGDILNNTEEISTISGSLKDIIPQVSSLTGTIKTNKAKLDEIDSFLEKIKTANCSTGISRIKSNGDVVCNPIDTSGLLEGACIWGSGSLDSCIFGS